MVKPKITIGKGNKRIVSSSTITKGTTTTTTTGVGTTGNTGIAGGVGGGGTSILQSSKQLQDKLHDLLTRLSLTIEHVRNWPSSTSTSTVTSTNNNNNNNNNNNSSNNESNVIQLRAKLIVLIKDIISSIQRIESFVSSSSSSSDNIQQQLQHVLVNCHIPYDLLDLLDNNIEINPDCYIRGLLLEAMKQLIGLRRRKNALQMLGSYIQNGLQQYELNQIQIQQQIQQRIQQCIENNNQKKQMKRKQEEIKTLTIDEHSIGLNEDQLNSNKTAITTDLSEQQQQQQQELKLNSTKKLKLEEEEV